MYLMGKLDQKNGEVTSRDDDLLPSEEKLLLQGTALETAANAVVITDANGVILWVNPAFTHVTGYTAGEVVGQTPRLLKSGKHSPEFYKKLWETILAGKTWRGSFTNRRKDGTLYYDEHIITPVRSKGGAITHFIAIMNDVTERRQAEAALRKSEGRFRLLLEQAVDAFFLHDEHGKLLDVNRRACESLGYSREELLKMSVSDVTSLSEEEVKSVWSQLQTASTVTINDYQRCKDGTRVPVEIRVGSVEIDGQKLILGLARDVTERKRAEENNMRSLALLRATLDSTADGILTIGSDRRILSFNETFVKMWGLPANILAANSDDLAIQYVLDQLQMPERFLAKVRHLYDHPLQESFDVLDFKDGRVFERYSRPMLAEGHPIGRVWSFRDVTDRKRAEARIAEQAAFLDKARDAIIVRDLEGKILFWNKGAERVYGWTDQEVLGRNVLEILHTEAKTFEELNGSTINHGEWHGELQHLTKDRGEIITEVRCTLIRDDEGHPKSVLSINTDITEKKKIEAQFMRAQRMESIGTLAGGVAHDLNNILAPIIMSINILRATSANPQTTKILESIEVSAKRGADIVRQVLSFARGLQGERIEVQPRHLLKDLENMIRDTFPKDIRLHFSIPDNIWTIFGDPTQVHQILMNLCVNARDAMPNGGTLTIGVENCELVEQCAAMNLQAKAGRYVNISVTDSGTGIPPELRDKIFEPFFTTKELYKGTGLGLSTVLAIVKSHEGIINVHSEPGKGTTFEVYLPAMKLSAEARKAQSGRVSVPRGNGETVLVVDDEASILTISSETLQAFGYRVLTATDGAEAVGIYSEHKNEIAVVLTDMMMPVMDGPATIRALMQINPAIKIVMTSGFDANDEMAKVSETGVKHFLTKPYSAATLLKTIRTILDEA
jgi:PAS domain S-box-containing protein